MNDDIQLIPAPPGTILIEEHVNQEAMTATYVERTVIAFELTDNGHPDDISLDPWVLGGTTAFRWQWKSSFGDECRLVVKGSPLEPDRTIHYRLGDDGKSWIEIEPEEDQRAATGS